MKPSYKNEERYSIDKKPKKSEYILNKYKIATPNILRIMTEQINFFPLNKLQDDYMKKIKTKKMSLDSSNNGFDDLLKYDYNIFYQ